MNRHATCRSQDILLGRVTFAFVDVETTGLSSLSGDRICEVAIMKRRGGREIARWHSLINPLRPVSPEARAVNGISDEMLSRSPAFEALAPQILSLLGDAVVVCHNAPFDIGFLSSEFSRAGLGMVSGPVVDTLVLARRHFQFRKNNLGFIAQFLGVVPEGLHRAMGDVVVLSDVFDCFLREFRSRGVRTLGELLSLQPE